MHAMVAPDVKAFTRYGGTCCEALLALRALRVEKELRWREVRNSISAITADLECAAAAAITVDPEPPAVRAPRPSAHVAAAAAAAAAAAQQRRRRRQQQQQQQQGGECDSSPTHPAAAYTSLLQLLTNPFQLIIFAPNHAAAARAHGGWRPLPPGKQFAPVRACTCQSPWGQ